MGLEDASQIFYILILHQIREFYYDNVLFQRTMYHFLLISFKTSVNLMYFGFGLIFRQKEIFHYCVTIFQHLLIEKQQ